MKNTYKLTITLTEMGTFKDIQMTRYVRAENEHHAWQIACDHYTAQGFAFQAAFELSADQMPWDLI